MGSVLVTLEQTGLATWIRESGVLYAYPLILFLHTLGLSTLVGLNSAIDIRLLGFGAGIPLQSLEKTFRVMWAGLALNAATGLLLFIADATRHISNPAFSVLVAPVFGTGVPKVHVPVNDENFLAIGGSVHRLLTFLFGHGNTRAMRAGGQQAMHNTSNHSHPAQREWFAS